MIAQMVLNERGDKEVAVVITWLATQRQRVVMLFTHGFQTLGHQLLFQELVRFALVDKQPLAGRPVGH